MVSQSVTIFNIIDGSITRKLHHYDVISALSGCVSISVCDSIKTLKNRSFHLRFCPSIEKRFICNERFPTLFLFLFIDRLHITSYLPYRSCCIYRTDKVLQFFCFPIIWMCTERLISLLEMPIVRWSIN